MRSFTEILYAASTADRTETVKLREGGVQGKFCVHAKKTGAGSATLAVEGGFKADLSGSNDRFSVKTAQTINAALTDITAGMTDDKFPYLYLTIDRTGSSAIEIYITQT